MAAEKRPKGGVMTIEKFALLLVLAALVLPL